MHATETFQYLSSIVAQPVPIENNKHTRFFRTRQYLRPFTLAGLLTVFANEIVLAVVLYKASFEKSLANRLTFNLTRLTAASVVAH